MVVCSSGRIVSLSALASQGSDPTSSEAAMEAPSAAGLGLGSAAGVPHVQVTHATAAVTFLHFKVAFTAVEGMRHALQPILPGLPIPNHSSPR